MGKFRAVFRVLYSEKYLIYTNVAVGGGLLAIGDGVAQQLKKKMDPESESASWDSKRTTRVGFIGSVISFGQHFYYNWLDRFLPGRTGSLVFKKIIMDQTVVAPPSLAFFLTANRFLESGSITEAREHMGNLFMKIYMADWVYWPLLQAINFYFLPTHLRITYLSVCTLVWNSFLCYMDLSAKRKARLQAENKPDNLNEERIVSISAAADKLD